MALDASAREALIRRYEEGPRNLRAAWEKVPEPARQWRPGQGKWSAHEVVCHTADSETNAYVRIRFLAAEANPTILGYDQDRWAEKLDYDGASPELALATTEAVRANTVAAAAPAAGVGVGEHGDALRVGQVFGERTGSRIYAEHLEKHTRQIERNLEAWKARKA